MRIVNLEKLTSHEEAKTNEAAKSALIVTEDIEQTLLALTTDQIAQLLLHRNLRWKQGEKIEDVKKMKGSEYDIRFHGVSRKKLFNTRLRESLIKQGYQEKTIKDGRVILMASGD